MKREKNTWKKGREEIKDRRNKDWHGLENIWEKKTNKQTDRLINKQITATRMKGKYTKTSDKQKRRNISKIGRIYDENWWEQRISK